MQTVIDAVYEDGVLKPLTTSGLKEHQRYRLTLDEINPSFPEELKVDPELAAEIERRATILPDGRKVIRLGNLFARYIHAGEEGEKLVEEALADVRREQKELFEAKLDKYYPLEEETPADK